MTDSVTRIVIIAHTREEIAQFINLQLQYGPEDAIKFNKHSKTSYGIMELKELLDYIFNGPPINVAEFLDSGAKTHDLSYLPR